MTETRRSVKLNDFIVYFILTLLLIGTTGCTLGPDYKRPDALDVMPESYKESAGWKLAQPELVGKL